MVCHGCYDAPCQLKLDAWEGCCVVPARTRSDGTRLVNANLARLFEDARASTSGGIKGFIRYWMAGSAARHLLRMLQLKARSSAARRPRAAGRFDFGWIATSSAANPTSSDAFARITAVGACPTEYLPWRMRTRCSANGWKQGAPGCREPLPHRRFRPRSIAGRPSSTVPASSRSWYRAIYEHLFIGDLYFSGSAGCACYFHAGAFAHRPGARQSRSSPHAGPMTRRGDEPPPPASPLHQLVLDKRHMPYALNDARMTRWNALFFRPRYEVSRLPGYQASVAANPFVAFRELPVASRYQFMLDGGAIHHHGVYQGPVCRGQVALNVIDDHFWVIFTDPNVMDPDPERSVPGQGETTCACPAAQRPASSLVQWRPPCPWAAQVPQGQIGGAGQSWPVPMPSRWISTSSGMATAVARTRR